MSNFIKLTHDLLDVGKITDIVSDKSTGAISLFVGTTRDHFAGKRVIRLDYEAYDSMAEKKMFEVCQILRSKWSLHNIAIFHRLGEVRPKEASVVIAVSSEHRKESLEAVQFAIDTLKATVPIWKKEVYEDGTEWKANAECPWKEKEKHPKIDQSLVQITASEEEVNSRIEAFIARKRAEIDCANVQEFCSRSVNEQNSEFSCARTDSIVVRRTGTSSHLRKSSAVNAFGPQTQVQQLKIKNEPVVKKEEQQDLPPGLGERLNQLEEHLFGNNRPVPQDVYIRLKTLEERVLYLEGLSPEYFSVTQNLIKVTKCDQDVKEKEENNEEMRTSLSNINKRIQELRASLVKPLEVPQIKMEHY